METERIKMRGIQWAHLLGYLLCVFYVYVWFFSPPGGRSWKCSQKAFGQDPTTPTPTPATGPRTEPQMPYFVNVLIKNIQLIKKYVMTRARSSIQRK